MDFKLIDNNIFEFYDYQEIFNNEKKLDGTIIYFPFKKLSYKSFNFFWYIPNKRFDNIIIDKYLNLIRTKESLNGSNFIEGIEVFTDGPYKLNFIKFDKLKYKIKNEKINNNLMLIHLELFL